MNEQPMTINGHLLLLIVATGLFVRVWSANDQSRSRFVTRGRSSAAVASPPNPSPIRPGRVVAQQTTSATTCSAMTSAHASDEQTWTRENCPIPLPAGITGGSYRVVDDTGRVARLDIAAADAETLGEILREILGTNSREVPADFYTTSVGTRRWYFIRLQTATILDAVDGGDSSTDVVAAETASGPQPFLNRKFDFTGYV